MESQTRWRALYDEVQRRYASGETLLGFALAMQLARATIRKFAVPDSIPARRPYGPGPSLLDP